MSESPGIRLVVIGTGQHVALAEALAAMLPQAGVAPIDAGAVRADPGRAAGADWLLSQATHLLSPHLGPEFGPLATDRLRARPGRLALMPEFVFGGFHPDVVAVTLDDAHLLGPTGTLHSRLAIAAWLAGYGAEAAARLFNRLVFARLGYRAAWAPARAALLRRFAAYGIDLAPGLDAWARDGCFMLAPDRPAPRLTRDLARIAASLLELPMAVPEAGATQAASDTPERPGNGVADAPGTAAPPGPAHPVLPPLADALGLPAEHLFTTANGTTLALPEFLAASFDAFAAMPRFRLRAADGVRAALTALDLADRKAPTGAAAAADMGSLLLTWWGGFVHVERASGLLLQVSPGDSEPGTSELLLDPATIAACAKPDAGPVRVPALGNAVLVAANGGIGLRREEGFLSATEGRFALSFAAPALGDAETLLPLAAAEAAALRRLFSRGWRHGAEVVPRAAIGLEPGLMVRLGKLRVDLRALRPALTEDGGVAFGEGAGAIRLLPDPAEANRDEVLAWHPDRAPPDAPSPIAFAASPGTRLRLRAEPEVIHLPLTVSVADREWLHRAYEYGQWPPLGRQAPELTLTRLAEQTAVLHRGREGAVLDASGVHRCLAAVKKTRPEPPPGIRNVGEFTLIDSALATGRGLPRIEGPVAICNSAEIQNYYHWIVEAALPLHIMLPYLPQGCRLLLPGAIAAWREKGGAGIGFDHLKVLAALGFDGLQVVASAADAVRVEDVTFPDQFYSQEFPAAALRSFRDRAHAAQSPGPATRKVFIQRRRGRSVGYEAQMGRFLKQEGFETHFLEFMEPAEQIRLFAEAAFVVSPHGAGLANLLWCRPGTRVLEITPRTEFRPYFWLLAEKLGLNYGVLPTRTSDGGYNGTLLPDMARLRALYAMLSLREAAPARAA